VKRAPNDENMKTFCLSTAWFLFVIYFWQMKFPNPIAVPKRKRLKT